MKSTAAVGVRRRAGWLGAVVPAAFVGLAACWWLAHPSGPELASTSGVVALVAGVVLVGLGGLPLLGVQPSVPAIAGFGLVWLAADVVTIWFDVAARADVRPDAVRVGQFMEGVSSAPGEVISALAALTIVVWTAVAGRSAQPSAPVAVVAALAGLGVAGPAVTGHATAHAVEPVLVVAHTLAAAWWCGTLAAMAMTITSRNGWRTALPVFSRFALFAVAVLTVTGVASGVIELGLGSAWWTTGYGRTMLAKAIVLTGLIGLGAWHRRHWVPHVAARRGTVERSLRSAVFELAAMAVVLGLAAGLASTNPGG